MAALTAAIVASLAGKVNSISTIFTLDIYKRYLNQDATEKKQVWVGRLTILAAMVLSIGLTWKDLLGIGGEGGFQFIQKYTGFISPGILAVFLLGMFWKRTTATAAIVGILAGFCHVGVFQQLRAGRARPRNAALHRLPQQSPACYEIPFLVCMGLSFAITMLLMVAISLAGPRINPRAIAPGARPVPREPADPDAHCHYPAAAHGALHEILVCLELKQ